MNISKTLSYSAVALAPLVSTLMVQGMTLDAFTVASGQIENVVADGELQTAPRANPSADPFDVVVESGGEANLIAETRVVLKDGFWSKSGSTLRVGLGSQSGAPPHQVSDGHMSLEWTSQPWHSYSGETYSIGGYAEADGGDIAHLALERNSSTVASAQDSGDVSVGASFTDTVTNTENRQYRYRLDAFTELEPEYEDEDAGYDEMEGRHLVSKGPFMAFDSSSSTVSPNGLVKGSGWAADPVTGGSVERVEIRVNGQTKATVLAQGSRTDVALVFDRPGFQNTGFEFSFNIGPMAPGNYSLQVRAVDSAGRVSQREHSLAVGMQYSDNDGIDDAWELANGLDPKDANDVYEDPDRDGVLNIDEWIAGTDPLGFSTATTTFGSTVPLSWISLTQNDSSQTEAVGATVGELSVGASGEATYQIPLWVTPGTSGMEPELALAYSSQGGNGLLGQGWNLSGLSSISRGPQTVAVDGQVVGMDYTATDRFYLDGQRLINVSGEYGASGTQYRTELDSFSKVVSYGSRGSGPAAFTVWTKSGLKMEYGHQTSNEGSTRDAWGHSEVLSWHIRRITDVAGNYMQFQYHEDMANGIHYVTRIDYTGNDAASLPTYASIRFEYESRSDTSFGYAKGVKVATNKRLKRIRGYYGETVVRTYTLNYEQQAGPVARSQLSSLVETGKDGKSYKPLTFDYSDPHSSEIAWGGGGNYAPPKPLNRGDKQNGTGFVDVNGDGYPDFVYARSGEPRATWLNEPSGWVAASSSYTLSGNLVDSDGKDQGIRFVDFNGDGLTDYMRGNGGSTSYAYRNTGSGWTYDPSWNLPTFIRGTPDPDEAHRHFIDVNGDGRVDFVYNNDGSYKGAYLNTGSGWQYSSAWIPKLVNNWANHSIFVDVNGDGLPDQIAHQNDDRVQYGVSINTGSGWTLYTSGSTYSKYLPPYPIARYHSGSSGGSGDNTLDVYGVEVVDMNGDGLSDLVYAEIFPVIRKQTYLNTGDGWVYTPAFNSQIDFGDKGPNRGAAMVDLNGDGLPDATTYEQSSTYRKTQLNTGKALQSQASGGLLYKLDLDYGSSYGNPGTQLVDIDADGFVDQVWHRGSSTGSTEASGAGTNNAKPRGLLTSVTNAFGVTAQIEYAALTQRDSSGAYLHYARSLDTLPSGQADVIGPMQVVSKLKHEDGAGGTYDIAYRYEGLRSDRLRGSLGFAAIITTDERTQMRSTVEFNQQWPYIGMQKSSTVEYVGVSPARLLSESSATYASQTATGGTTFPYAAGSTEISYDPDNANVVLTKTITTTTGMDGYGNPGTVTVRTEGSSSGDYQQKTTVSVYSNDATKWHLGRLTRSTVTATGSSLSTLVRRSEFQYEPATGLLKQEKIIPMTPAGAVDTTIHGSTTDYQYDAYGNVRLKTLSGSGMTSRAAETGYDTKGRFALWSDNALDHRTSATYDQNFGVPLSQTDPNGLVTTWTYDGFGRVTGQELPGVGSDTLKSATIRGWAASPKVPGALYFVATEAEGAPPAIQFHDKYGRETYGYTLVGGALDNGGLAQIVGSAVGYDNQSRPVYGYNPFFLNEQPVLSTVTEFDAYGRKKGVAIRDDSATAGSSLAVPASESSKRWADTLYYYSGLTASTVNPKGQKTTVTKDAHGRTTETVNNADAANAYEKGRVAYTYDAYGNLLTTTTYNDSARGDGSTPTTTLAYDNLGRKVSMADPNMGSWTYAYDAFGQLVSQTDAKSQTTTMTYDQLGRMVTSVDDEGTSTWHYDVVPWTTRKGFLHAVSTPAVTRSHASQNFTKDHVRHFHYDSLGRQTRTTNIIDGVIYYTDQTYDAHHRPDVLTYPDGFQVKNVYSSFGFLYKTQAAGGYSGLSGEVAAGHVFWEADNHTARGMIDGYQLGNGLTVDKIYDNVTGRLANILSGPGSSSSVMNHSYDYDALGNVTYRSDSANGETLYLSYDGLNRLVTSNSQAFTYDALGNIKTKAGVSGTYSYNSSRPNAVASIGGTSYAYDANGNRTSGGGVSMEWTPDNKLAKVTKGSQAALFWFDATGQRVLQIDSSRGTTHYVGSTYEYTVDEQNRSMRKCYIMTPAGRVAVRTVKGGTDSARVETRYLHQDSLGSIYAVTKEDGAVEQRFKYDAWGKQTITYDASSQAGLREAVERGYTDHEMMSDFGLIHMNGRVYDYGIARFASADPFVDDAKDAQSYNRYSYVSNNPLMYTDPSGYFKFKDILPAIIGIVAAAVTIATAGAGGSLIGAFKQGFFASLKAGLSNMGPGLAFAAGYNGGYWSGMSGSLLNGGSLGDAFSAAIKGGITGGLQGLASFGIGQHFNGLGEGFGRWLGRAAAHGAVGGASAAADGGKFQHGFVSSFASTGFMHSSAGTSLMNNQHIAVRVTTAAVVGGTSSELAGGKFENGATTAAFQHMFNSETTRARREEAPSWAVTIGKGNKDVEVEEDLGYGDRIRTTIEKIHGVVKTTDLDVVPGVIKKAISAALNVYAPPLVSPKPKTALKFVLTTFSEQTTVYVRTIAYREIRTTRTRYHWETRKDFTTGKTYTTWTEGRTWVSSRYERDVFYHKIGQLPGRH